MAKKAEVSTADTGSAYSDKRSGEGKHGYCKPKPMGKVCAKAQPIYDGGGP